MGKWFVIAVMAAASASATLLTPNAALAVVGGQVNTFQDGTTQGWTNGGSAPAPTNVSTGGPAGAGDRYLSITSDNRLATFNNTTWAGNYASEGIADIDVDFRNPNSTALQMRVVMFGPGGSRWTSTTPALVPADSGWHHYRLSLRESDLTLVLGSDTYAATIADVRSLMLRHDTVPSSGGSFFIGSVGIDNITAVVPEPGSLAAGAAAAAVFLVRRRHRRR